MEKDTRQCFVTCPTEVKDEWLAKDGRGIPGRDTAKLTVLRQCELLEIPRTAQYRKRKEPNREREYKIKAYLDYWNVKMPSAGSRKMKTLLEEMNGIVVSRKLIRRYMAEMGIYATYPKKNLSKPRKDHKKFPYLLRGMNIFLPNQVWAVDITYIKMTHGFMYLTAVIDWYSRRIVGWGLSNTLDTAPVIEAIRSAIKQYGVPAILNSDQGSQFTSDEYIKFLQQEGIRQSMDGKGRWVDNVIIERWFRSLKWEEIYINEYASPRELRHGIARYIEQYNIVRPHMAHGMKTPTDAYCSKFVLVA